ncbi:hypothetical protein C0J52_22711 [Blattella germanica]|nr:hypothetical protein C0J52_22711 [Blattella germanica]
MGRITSDASEARRVLEISNTKVNTMSSNSNVVNPSQSYSTITQSGPTKDQAIVIEAHDGIPIKDYIYAIGKLTDPTNIRFVSRISNNRICIYLANKKSVEEICTHYPRIEINNIHLESRIILFLLREQSVRDKELNFNFMVFLEPVLFQLENGT